MSTPAVNDRVVVSKLDTKGQPTREHGKHGKIISLTTMTATYPHLANTPKNVRRFNAMPNSQIAVVELDDEGGRRRNMLLIDLTKE